MKWAFLPGFVLGAAAALFVFRPRPGVEIIPHWWGALSSLDAVEAAPSETGKGTRFLVRDRENSYRLFDGSGRIAQRGTAGDSLAAFSGNGEFHIRYGKVGREVEFYNAAGERFWKIASMEYPYLSYAGRLILLMNGDQTGIRMVDESGNAIGTPIAGRTCTVVSFADRADRAAVGFLDGSYRFIGPRGSVTHRGRTPLGTVVKSMAVSDAGTYGAVHYGDAGKDYLRVIELGNGEYGEAPLSAVHHTRIAIHVADDGDCTVLDRDRLIRVSPSGRMRLSLAVPACRPGHAALRREQGLIAFSYTTMRGAAMAYLIREDGTVLFRSEYPTESFLDASLRDSILFLRGSDHLFCYLVRR